LRSPKDNSGKLHIWGVNCSLKHAPFVSPVVFAWDPIGENVDYNYTIYRISLGPDHSWSIAANGQTRETTISIALSPSQENEYYAIQMGAFRSGKPIGVIVTQGLCNYVPGYQFTVSGEGHK
jgi:hypothetical protein